MSTPISLNEVPQNFLDKGQWAKLRTSVPSYLIALTYIISMRPIPTQTIRPIFSGGATARLIKRNLSLVERVVGWRCSADRTGLQPNSMQTGNLANFEKSRCKIPVLNGKG